MGWWKLKAWKKDENGNEIKLNDCDREHIAKSIKEGYTGGDVAED